jgi:GNAT superfamily N-acetyltransferase
MKTRNPAHITLIRPATVDDIPTIINLNREGILSWGKDIQPVIQEWMDAVCTNEHFAEMIANPEKTLLVAEFDGKISGTTYGYPLKNKFHSGGMYLSVNGQGIATLLMVELIRQARSLGLNALSSEVYEHNYGALRFLRRQGWITRTIEKYKGISFYQKVLVLS